MKNVLKGAFGASQSSRESEHPRSIQELQKTKHHETSQQLSIPKNWMIGCCGNSAVSRVATKVSPMLFNRLGPWGKAMAKYSWMICMICMVLQHSHDGCGIAASSVLLACIIVPTFLSQIGPKSWCKILQDTCGTLLERIERLTPQIRAASWQANPALECYSKASRTLSTFTNRLDVGSACPDCICRQLYEFFLGG